MPNPQYKKLVDAHPHLSGVNVEDIDTKAELPVHLILGTSIYPKIKMREVPKIGKEDEPVAEMTKLGWVIMSPGIEADGKAYLTNSSVYDYDRLCSLDVLGLRDTTEGDQAVVHQEFKEQLTRDKMGGMKHHYCGKRIIQSCLTIRQLV